MIKYSKISKLGQISLKMDYNTFLVLVYLRHPHRLVQMSLAGNLLQSTEDPLLVHPVKHLLRQVVAHHPLLGERVGRVSRHP